LQDSHKTCRQNGEHGQVFTFSQLYMLPVHTRGQVSGPPKGGIPFRCLRPAVLAASYRTWAVVAVRCKIAYFSVEALKLFKNMLK
jgi:hypothetical protein